MKIVTIKKPFKDGTGYETITRSVAENEDEQRQLDEERLETARLRKDYINSVWGDKSYYRRFK